MLFRPPATFPGLAAAAVILSAVSLVAPLSAEERHGHAHEDAHEHGVSKLKLAVDGAALEIEIVSPGSDIVGFEHPPANAADRQAIEKAAAVFRDAGAMFAFPVSARCRVVSTEVDAPAAQANDHDRHEHGKHHGEKHRDAISGKDADHHSEFHGHYRYRCGNPKRLTHVDIKLFDQFPRAREIEAEAITPSGQIARELTRSSARLKF